MFYPYIGKLQYKYGLFNYLNETDLKKTYKPHNLNEENMFELIPYYLHQNYNHLYIKKFYEYKKINGH